MEYLLESSLNLNNIYGVDDTRISPPPVLLFFALFELTTRRNAMLLPIFLLTRPSVGAVLERKWRRG